jgi:hypothetical protein
MNTLLDIAPAQTATANLFRRGHLVLTSALLQNQQNTPARRVGNGVKGAIQRRLREHENYTYRENRRVSI